MAVEGGNGGGMCGGGMGRGMGRSGNGGRVGEWKGRGMGQPELRDFSASHVRSANSASWLVVIAAGGGYIHGPRRGGEPDVR